MRLLSVRQAKSIWRLQWDDMNPRGLDIVPVLEGIQRRYLFQRAPRIEDMAKPQGLHFSNGSFPWQEKQIEISGLSIYRDGFVAETRHSTGATDDFLSDLLSFLTQKHGLSSSDALVREKNHVSCLIVTADVNLDELSQGITAFRPSLHSATGLDFRVSSLRFGAGPASKVFTLEYEAGTDFNQARFFSEAPVPTDVHLNLLTELETVLLAHSQAL